ncbi:hypothetical protein ACFUEM_34180 [Streptomyces anulatus]|uniref:hypothetical protein n=1 Tax=Streptomyces anulatus TaxID=1892 RepID=UPI0035DE1778
MVLPHPGDRRAPDATEALYRPVVLLVLVVLVVALLVDLAHRYPNAATPMLVGLGGLTVIVAVVVPIAVR